MSVVEAVQRDLEGLPPDLAGSGLAATALALAGEIDKRGNSATSKSMCAKALNDTLRDLRALAPARRETDALDDLTARRERRLSASAARP